MLAAGAILSMLFIGVALEGVLAQEKDELENGNGASPTPSPPATPQEDESGEGFFGDGEDEDQYTLNDTVSGDQTNAGMGNQTGGGNTSGTGTGTTGGTGSSGSGTGGTGAGGGATGSTGTAALPPDMSSELENLLFGDGLSEQNASAGMLGGAGGDHLIGSNIDNIGFGGEGDDTLEGVGGDDTLFGQEGNDSLLGASGDDILQGGEGTDTLDGGEGNDLLALNGDDLGIGGAGADTFALHSANAGVVEVADFELGTDQLLIRYDEDTPPSITIQTDTVNGNSAVYSDGNQILFLSGVTGLTDADIVLQKSGIPDDDGGTLTDIDTSELLNIDTLLNGGTLDDISAARAMLDDVFETEFQDGITGGADGDLIEGGDGDDFLYGDTGADTLTGGTGDDEMHGDLGDDSMSGGSDTDLLVGGEGNDTLSGDGGSDLLFGGVGDDTLEGGDGNDFLQGGFGADSLVGGEGNDVLDGTFATGTQLNTGDARNFGLSDEDSADTLIGGEGDDRIMLGAGDIATGGAGSDLFEGGTYVGGNAPGVVSDFNPAEDQIQVVVDLMETPNPEIEVIDFADGSGADIVVNGVTVLSVTGAQGLDASEIAIRDVALVSRA